MSAAPRSTRAKKAKAPVLTLVQPRKIAQERSEETIECAKKLLVDAVNGELVGLAFVALYREGGSEVDAVGCTLSHPTFSRGLAMELVDLMGDRARGD